MLKGIKRMLKMRHNEAAELPEKVTAKDAEVQFRLAFDSQIVNAHRIAREHGWHDEEHEDGTRLALIHCEISEALQALRDGNRADKHCPDFSSLEIELADVVIRIMDYAGLQNLDIAGAIIAKMHYNETRPYKHGGKNF